MCSVLGSRVGCGVRNHIIRLETCRFRYIGGIYEDGKEDRYAWVTGVGVGALARNVYVKILCFLGIL